MKKEVAVALKAVTDEIYPSVLSVVLWGKPKSERRGCLFTRRMDACTTNNYNKMKRKEGRQAWGKGASGRGLTKR
jgi:hypothetical protein